jgi:hypothetical protein
LYQLPLFNLPSNLVTVNRQGTGATPVRPVSQNRAMVMVELTEGWNGVRIHTRHSPGAWWVSLLTLCGLIAAPAWSVLHDPAAPRRRWREPEVQPARAA